MTARDDDFAALRRRRFLGYNPDVIVDYLKETAIDVKAMESTGSEAKFAIAEYGHHCGVAGENTNLTVERGGDDRVCLALEQHTFW
ncbi:MAG TPA: hypothetical protein VIC03_01945 [Gemmatimonadaceae bacterium]|jgi:hypothetical protein